MIQTDDQAAEQGKEAQKSGKSRASNPIGEYPVKSLRRSWFKGWDEAAREVIKIQAIRMKVPEVPASIRGMMWPEGTPMPNKYVRPRPVPCPKCRRLLLDTGAQAVVVRAIHVEVAFMWCRGCGDQFKMGVQ